MQRSIQRFKINSGNCFYLARPCWSTKSVWFSSYSHFNLSISFADGGNATRNEARWQLLVRYQRYCMLAKNISHQLSVFSRLVPSICLLLLKWMRGAHVIGHYWSLPRLHLLLLIMYSASLPYWPELCTVALPPVVTKIATKENRPHPRVLACEACTCLCPCARFQESRALSVPHWVSNGYFSLYL